MADKHVILKEETAKNLNLVRAKLIQDAPDMKMTDDVAINTALKKILEGE